MKKTSRWPIVGTIGLGLLMTALTGCQTNIAGMTLPSPHYLQHPPQYIPPTPPFPLARELAQMEGANAGGAGALPAPVAPPIAPAAIGPGGALPAAAPAPMP